MRRTALLAVAVAGAMGLGGVGTAYADGSTTDLLVVSVVSAGLTISGGATAAPTTLPAVPIGSTTGVSVPGSLLTVSDLRGVASGWHVTAQYATPAASVLTALSTTVGSTVTDLGGSNVKVSAAVGTTGTGVFPSYLATPTTLGTNTVTVASAASNSAANQLTTFTPSYQVTAPATATAAQVFAGSVVYTVSDAPASLG